LQANHFSTDRSDDRKSLTNPGDPVIIDIDFDTAGFDGGNLDRDSRRSQPKTYQHSQRGCCQQYRPPMAPTIFELVHSLTFKTEIKSKRLVMRSTIHPQKTVDAIITHIA